MHSRLTLVHNFCLKQYTSSLPEIKRQLQQIENRHMDARGYRYYHIIASCSSNMIEGSRIDPDTYLKLKGLGCEKDINEIDDLISAYEFAQTHIISLNNVLKTHAKIAKHIHIKKEFVGKLRSKDVIVLKDGRIRYQGVSAQKVETEMQKLFADIDLLISRKLTPEQIKIYLRML